MAANETRTNEAQELYQWPTSFISSPDILSYLYETGSQENSNSDKSSGSENAAASSVLLSQDSNHVDVNQQLVPPLLMCPRPVYENIYSLPLTQTIPKPRWDQYDMGLPLQSPLLAQDILGNYPTATTTLENGLDENRLLEELAACPELDTDPSLVAEVLSSDDNDRDSANHWPPSVHERSLTLDTNFTSTAFSSPLSWPSSGATTSLNCSDLSAYSESPFRSPDFTPRSSTTLSSTPMTPGNGPAPAFTRPEAVRGACPSRVTSFPRVKKRGVPYTLDGSRTHNRGCWSTGSSAVRPTVPEPGNKSPFSSPSTNANQLALPTNLAMAKPDIADASVPISQSPRVPLPSNLDNNDCHSAHVVQSATPQGSLLTLPNPNAISNRFFEHHFDNIPVGPPDLLGPLREEPLRPPAQDMIPRDPSMMPHEQELRFENDLYTPRWVRGHGNKREGWCGICKPGRWLVLKNSAFWYDKSFSHGVCAATGQAFAPPRETRKTEGNANVWEGLCDTCEQWIALVSSKKTGTTWFRHAYKVSTFRPIQVGAYLKGYIIFVQEFSADLDINIQCHQNNKPTEPSKRRRSNCITGGSLSLEDVASKSARAVQLKSDIASNVEAVDGLTSQNPPTTFSLQSIISAFRD